MEKLADMIDDYDFPAALEELKEMQGK